MVGMSITAMVMAALMSFTSATATAWKAGEVSESLTAAANQASLRVGRIVRKSMLAGFCHPGALDNSGQPAAVVLWSGDANGDSEIQYAEVELLEFDPVDRVLYHYAPSSSDTDAITAAELADEAIIADVRSRFSRTPVIGGITAMRLYRHARTDAGPALEMTLKMTRGGKQHIHTVALSMRGAPLATAEDK
jgi:type II secretory pathway component PulJ